ncbi:MAG: shikimate kinase, partial [Desulfurococcales archaeon]|nr:shikimate kinase [Desulfurococcales archaeon]
GLKSSSALVNSIVLGLADALGVEMGLEEAARLGVTVSRRAGLTLTGAYDDSLATLLPGVFITDNRGLRILRRFTFNETLYAVAAVPPRERPIQTVEPGVFESLGRHYSRAVDLALEGRWVEAMAVNAVLTLVATGLDEWSVGLVSRALEHEATLLAGVSGKGPSVYALTTDPRGVADAWGEAGVEVIVARLLGGVG